MKKLIFGLFTLVLSLTTVIGFAQAGSTKTALFGEFAQSIEVTTSVLEKPFTSKEGDKISFEFSGKVLFEGIVLSNDVKYANLQTVTIQIPKFKNSFFAISKIINADNSISYTGRIINNMATDGFVIKRSDNNKYNLQKVNTERILQDCSYN